MKKSVIVLLSMLAVLVLALPGLAQDDPYADVDPSGVTVEFWHQHSGARGEELDKIVEEFNETNEWGIVVEASNQGSYDDIFSKVRASLTAGGGADLMPDLVVAYQNQAA